MRGWRRRGCTWCATRAPAAASWLTSCPRRSPAAWTSCSCATSASPARELVAAARVARELCERAGALLIVNDDPAVALAAGADGVHVGQDDMPVARVREIVGPEVVIGLSTHTPAEATRAVGLSGPLAVDYIGVGPVYATPTKPGRPATGLQLVRHAAAHTTRPWFAIGGIDATNAAAVLAAGARRVAVVRAIADATDPEGAARALRTLLDEHPLDDPLEHAHAGAAHA